MIGPRSGSIVMNLICWLLVIKDWLFLWAPWSGAVASIRSSVTADPILLSGVVSRVGGSFRICLAARIMHALSACSCLNGLGCCLLACRAKKEDALIVNCG